MKRNLNQNQYQMSSGERDKLWYAIRRQTHGSGDHETPRSVIRPALAMTAVMATLTLMVVWHLDSRQLMQNQAVGNIEVASLETRKSEMPSPAANTPLRQEEPALARQGEERSAPPSTKVADAAYPAEQVGKGLAKEDVVAAKALAPVLTGRVLDKDSGEPLAYANVMIRGTTFAATTDSLGNFRFENLPPGLKVELMVKLLSYDPVEVAVDLPQSGMLEQDLYLEPVIVATLQAFEVEGAKYMVEIKSAVTERPAKNKDEDKYAVDSVEDTLDKKAGVVMRAGELFIRGGRSDDAGKLSGGLGADNKPASRHASPAAVEPMPGTGSVTGGTTPPNGDQVELMYFESAGVNPFVTTEDDSLSTFAVDVDNASWTLARNYLSRGMLPPKNAIRVEEFVNAFDAGWPRHTDQSFRIHTEGARSRFGDGYHLLRIGLVGKDIDASKRKPANLVFVIDVSGSMARESRLGTVKKALHILLDELREGDRVGIVVYGSQGEVRLPLTDIGQRAKIGAAIDQLQTNGSTNAAAGLDLAYKMARESYDAGIINRLVLCSDGVANTGMSTEAGGILDIVRKASDEGITLSTIGFGMGNYNDVLMEKLANQGDGNYFYVDKMAEAERVFRQNLTGLLQTIAREVKVQVEFNEAFVQRWRLLGYENRDVADEDFRNDKVDAGEVGVGHQVTALYELKLTRPADREADAGSGEVSNDLRLPDPAPAFRVGTVRLRHEAPAHDTVHAGQVTEIEQAILLTRFEGDYAAGTPWMRVQTVVAEFAEILRGSYWAKGHSLAELVPVADALASELQGDEQVQELARMIRQAADLESAED